MKDESNVVTYEEVEQRLKNVPFEKLTAEDVFDRYIGYGDNDELQDIKVQQLLLKHNFTEYLINSIETIIADKTVIEGIATSNLLKDSKYRCIGGKIESVAITEDKELPKGFVWLIVSLVDQAKEGYKLKYMYYPQKQETYKNEIEQSIGKDVLAIVERLENKKELRLCCLLQEKLIKINDNTLQDKVCMTE